MSDENKKPAIKRVEPRNVLAIVGFVLLLCTTVASTAIALVNADNHVEVTALYESKEALRRDMDYRWENVTGRLKNHEDIIIGLQRFEASAGVNIIEFQETQDAVTGTLTMMNDRLARIETLLEAQK